jgi:hypothetical protein
MFTVAAAPLRIPKALMIGGGMRSWGWLMRKFSRERSVCAPQYLSAGTWISPKASLSVLVSAILAGDVDRYLWVVVLVTLVDLERRDARDDVLLLLKHVLRALAAVLGTMLLAGPETAAARTD